MCLLKINISRYLKWLLCGSHYQCLYISRAISALKIASGFCFWFERGNMSLFFKNIFTAGWLLNNLSQKNVMSRKYRDLITTFQPRELKEISPSGKLVRLLYSKKKFFINYSDCFQHFISEIKTKLDRPIIFFQNLDSLTFSDYTNNMFVKIQPAQKNINNKVIISPIHPGR